MKLQQVQLKKIEAEFISNTAGKSGGAISNTQDGWIEEIANSTFKENTAQNAGAIDNSHYGFIGKIINTLFQGNKSTDEYEARGGAIENHMAQIEEISNSTFDSNTAEGIEKARGGAINNWESEIKKIDNSVFKNNSAIVEMVETEENSNAPQRKSAAAPTIKAEGGAIYTRWSKIGLIKDSQFINNSVIAKSQYGEVSAKGGAIYNKSGDALNIAAIDKDTVFSGNHTVETIYIGSSDEQTTVQSNAIHNDGGVINLNAGNASVIINDKITGNYEFSLPKVASSSDDISSMFDSENTININRADINPNEVIEKGALLEDEITVSETLPTFGTVQINNEIDGNIVHLHNGTLKLGHHIYTDAESEALAGQMGVGSFGQNSVFMAHGGTISTQDGVINNHHLGNFALMNDINLQLDGDFEAQKLDTISATQFHRENDSSININNIAILKPTTQEAFSMFVLGEGMNSDVHQSLADAINYTGGDIVYSPIYTYQANYDKATGMMNFGTLVTSRPSDSFSPAVQATPVAAQMGGIATQLATFGEAFYNMDTFMLRDVNERILMKNENKYALLKQGMFYDNAITRRDNREAWLRPYVTFEEVDLKNGPKVDNIAYGTYLGTNSPIRTIRNGWDGAWGFYVGYNGSKQKFQSTDVYQNGGTLGITGELYKRNFFTGLTVNAGASAGKAHTMFGNDDFSMFTTGVASKSGYNFEFKGGKFIIQPSVLLGYSFVNTFDYTNSSGVKISSDPIHAFQLEPGVRFIANLGNGWRPYMGVSMICNFFDKAKFKANDVSLPETSIKPYVRYGLGVQKTISDRFSSYGQAFVTNGGRTGVGLQAGLSYVY